MSQINLSDEERAAIMQYRKRKKKTGDLSRFFLLFIIAIPICAMSIFIIQNDDDQEPFFQPNTINTMISYTPGIPPTGDPGIGSGSLMIETTPSPTAPDFQATNQALESTQKAVKHQMNTATAQAEYYALMKLKNETEREIEALNFQQDQAQTATVEAARFQATRTKAVADKQDQNMSLEIQINEDQLKTQQEKNDLYIQNLNLIMATIRTAIQVVIILICVLCVVFIGWILRKAALNHQWEMDQTAQKEKQINRLEAAETISKILALKEQERALVYKLIQAVARINKLDDFFVPRFDKIQKNISQPERDEAVKILVKYERCFPVQQGKATQLIQGTFRDLKDEIESGEFPPSNRVETHLKNTYAQHSTPLNNLQQFKTVQKIGEGVYIGN